MKSIQNCCLPSAQILQQASNQSGLVLDKNSTVYKIQNRCMQTKQAFDKSCDNVGAFLDTKPTLYKVAIFATHLFRSLAVLGMIAACPFSPQVSIALLIGSSLLYRAAVERFCTFRFTLPSLVGGSALWMTRQAVIALSAGSAFTSIGALFAIGFGACSLAGYLVFVARLSHFDVERRMSNVQKNCCP